MKDTHLNALNEHLKNSKPNHGWEPDDGSALAERQVWTVAGGCGDQPGWCWLLLERINGQSANFAPIAAHAELAGPDDLFVPIDRTGIPGIVSLELECTLHRDALGECLGRLPNKIFTHILDARRDMDDPEARNAYEWGLSYFSQHSPCAVFHQAIVETIERLQISVRQAVYGEQSAALIFPVDIPWSAFRSQFEAHPVPKAAADGKKLTPCMLAKRPTEEDSIAESAPSEVLWAKVYKKFETMRAETEFCNEWFVKTPIVGEPATALVYLEDREQAIGKAMVCSEPGGYRVTLNEVDLSPDEPAITDPAHLRLVILLAE